MHSAVDAFAAPVREAARAAVAEQVGEPGRQVAAGQVAVARGRRPAGHQAERDPLRRHQRAAPQRLLHVEQAEVVLAPLAQHHLLRLRPRLGVEPVELPVDLALQVAGEGGEPDRALVALRPEARRRDVAEGLADAGAGLRQHHAGMLLLVHGVEGGARSRGVVGLLGPGLGGVAEQQREPLPRRGGRHRVVSRRWRRRALLPVLEPGPDGERARLARRPRARGRPPARRQRGEHRIAPGPAGAIHGAGDGGCLPAACEARPREGREELPGGGEQGLRLVLAGLGQGEPERAGETAHRRHGEPRRVDEGEELQQVERREAGQSQPAGGGPRVADVGHRPGGSEALAGRVVGEARGRAVLVQPDRVARRHHERRRARQRRRRGGGRGGLARLGGGGHRPGV